MGDFEIEKKNSNDWVVKNILPRIEDNDLNRRTGRTTRMADACIQELFKQGYTVIRDHHGTRESHRMLFSIIEKRLKIEHHTFDVDRLIYRKDVCAIALNIEIFNRIDRKEYERIK